MLSVLDAFVGQRVLPRWKPVATPVGYPQSQELVPGESKWFYSRYQWMRHYTGDSLRHPGKSRGPGSSWRD